MVAFPLPALSWIIIAPSPHFCIKLSPVSINGIPFSVYENGGFKSTLSALKFSYSSGGRLNALQISIFELPSPLKIIFVAASVNISALSSTQRSCFLLISKIFWLVSVEPFPVVFSAFCTISSIAEIKNPAEPVAKSMTLLFLSISRIFTIILVT